MLAACDLEASDYEPAPRSGSKVSASISGRGTATKTITLSNATYVCTTKVTGNRTSYGDAHFAAVLHGNYRELLANDIAASGSWDKVIDVGGGDYLVEVTAEQGASWTVACK